MEKSEKFSVGRERRELFYRARRKIAQKIASDNIANALKLKGFKELFDRWNAIPFELAHAEYYENAESVEKLKAEQGEILSGISNILKKIDLSIDDLKPRIICNECKDTGWNADGILCDCFASFK